ncbi:MAG: helix-turn-helix domain-containing protein [Oscillospiraceae bacterium]|nr:helix-turn-helix domain-containing protein [Oscillospiraceae bacterium]
MTYTEKSGSRFEQIFIDEPLRKFLYENEITLDNYLSHQDELKKLFPDEESYHTFLNAYLSSSGIISYRQFLKAPQKIDLFLHPRYIQQRPHIHDFYEIKYLLKGSGTVHISSELIFLKQSDLCLISPYVPHSSEIYSDDAIMVNLVLPSEHLQCLLPRVMSFPNIFQQYFSPDQTLSAESRFLHCSTKQDPEIYRLVQSLLEYYSKKKGRTISGNLISEAYLEQIFLQILSLQPAEKEEERNRINEEQTLETMTAYIRENLQDVSLSEISKLLHFSTPYTSKLIRKKTGYTFQMLLLILRMEKAAELLKGTDWPVDRIAAEIGLTGKTNFYRQFKNFYGMSPATFRKKE